ncbi:MAG: ADP-ribosylglycohydrolase family protein [Pedobacter sp.]
MEEENQKLKHPVDKIINVRCLPEYYSGCLLGGAVADALGASAEGLSPAAIHEHFGAAGVRDYGLVFGREGAVTAHTQLALFTAEGVLRAKVKAEEYSTPLSIVAPVYNAYQRWLATQDGICDASMFVGIGGGQLIRWPDLYQNRHAEACCLEALTGGRLGQPDLPINDDRGCGAAVRMAPLGLFYCSESIFRRLDPATVDQTLFTTGCQLGALTHGHPDAFLAAACQALLVFRLIRGDELYDAVQNTLAILVQHPRHEPCRSRLEDVLTGNHGAETPDDENYMTASQILAQAIRCALEAHGDFSRGVLAAVNLGGPSAGRAALTGQLLGASLGRGSIPDGWLRRLELHDVIDGISEDLFVGFEPSGNWLEKYPAW